MSLINKDMVRRIVSTVVDYDMQYLFPPLTPMENLEDAAEGSYQNLPRKTLRERPYGPMPIRLRPDYRGDFLEQLREKAWMDTEMKTAANPYNIYDYSMPEEMLKHMEEPMPDDRTDIFIERNKVDDQVGMQPIRDWYDRGWDDTDAPEMSEDKVMRMWKAPVPLKTAGPDPRHVIASYLMEESEIEGPLVSNVIASFLMRACPACLSLDNIKTAVDLSFLEKTERWSGTNNRYVSLKSDGVSVRLARAEPRTGRWIFHTSSGGPIYTTIFQFVPKGPVKDLTKLDVRVSCSCPSWLFWGAQWNSWRNDYMYGTARPLLKDPKVRDPQNRFLVCKHALACIPIVSKYRLMAITPKIRERLQKKPVLKFEKIPEKVPIPADLKKFQRIPEVKEAIKNWEKWSPDERKEFLADMDSPGAVAFLGHKFPPSAAEMVAERLLEMSKTLPQPSHRRLAEKYSKYFL